MISEKSSGIIDDIEAMVGYSKAEMTVISPELSKDVIDRQLARDALRASRERHRLLIENLPVGLFRKNPGQNGKFLLVNQALVEMFGYASRDEYLRINMTDLCENAADWVNFCGKLIDVGKVIGEEMRLRRNDGTLLWGSVTANLVCSSSKVLYINGLVEDITERKLLEAQLGQAQKLEAMGQLAAGIAHEIKTPIQYVGDNTRFVQESFGELVELFGKYEELLGQMDIDPSHLAKFKKAADEADVDYLFEEIPGAVRQSLEGVGRVVEIVKAMKEFSHPGEKDKKPADLSKVIESTITLARNEWKYVSEVNMDFAPDLPPVPILMGDFKQVVLNMLINAAHAIADAQGDENPEKGLITVSTRRDGEWAEVRVSDTGTGIPEEIRPKIFDLFFTTKDVGKGTGQGLAISRAVIVEKHGGTIEFETQMNEGTTFIIRIPINPDSTSPKD
jgi:PAS domain S-box-containing protein